MRRLMVVLVVGLLGGLMTRLDAGYTVTVKVQDLLGNPLQGYWVKFTCKDHSPKVQTLWRQTNSQGMVSFPSPNIPGDSIPGDHYHHHARIDVRDQLNNPNYTASLNYVICHGTETKVVKVNTGVILYHPVYPYMGPVGIDETGMITQQTVEIPIFLTSEDTVPQTVDSFRITTYFDPTELYIESIEPDTTSGFYPVEIDFDNVEGWITYYAVSPEGTEITEESDLQVATVTATYLVVFDPCWFFPFVDSWLYMPYEKTGGTRQFPEPTMVNGHATVPHITEIVFVGQAPSLPQGSMYIPNVPDWNQPPLSGSINYCTPVAVLNILDYYQNVVGCLAGLVDPADQNRYPFNSNTADLIGYFMDTNNSGSICRANGTTYPAASGTYVADQDTGFAEYLAWNTAGQFCPGDPAPPPWKIGYFNLNVQKDTQVGWNYYVNQINSQNPVKLDFLHWNIINTGQILVDSATGDTFVVYQWGAPDTISPYPEEHWNLIDYPPDQNIGHAATGVGYIPNWNGQNWVIVHDNWNWTPRNIVIPWANWVATVSMTQPPTEKNERNFQDKTWSLWVNGIAKGELQVRLSLAKDLNRVKISLYDVQGRVVRKLYQGRLTKGSHNLNFSVDALSSGIYFLGVDSGEQVKFHRLVIVH